MVQVLRHSTTQPYHTPQTALPPYNLTSAEPSCASSAAPAEAKKSAISCLHQGGGGSGSRGSHASRGLVQGGATPACAPHPQAATNFDVGRRQLDCNTPPMFATCGVHHTPVPLVILLLRQVRQREDNVGGSTHAETPQAAAAAGPQAASLFVAAAAARAAAAGPQAGAAAAAGAGVPATAARDAAAGAPQAVQLRGAEAEEEPQASPVSGCPGLQAGPGRGGSWDRWQGAPPCSAARWQPGAAARGQGAERAGPPSS